MDRVSLELDRWIESGTGQVDRAKSESGTGRED